MYELIESLLLDFVEFLPFYAIIFIIVCVLGKVVR